MEVHGCAGLGREGKPEFWFNEGETPQTLIASGLLAHEADEIAAAFAEYHGLREVDRRHGGEWAALLLRAC